MPSAAAGRLPVSARILRYHVIPTKDHWWAVKRHGAMRATRLFATRAEAWAWAVSRADEAVMHRSDGTIEAVVTGER